jgi:hypothetical protein
MTASRNKNIKEGNSGKRGETCKACDRQDGWRKPCCLGVNCLDQHPQEMVSPPNK